MRRWEGVVQRRREASSQPGRHRADTGLARGDVERRRLELEIDLALREVRPAGECWKVARQGQLAGGRHHVSECGGGRASPPNQEVSDPRHRRSVGEHRIRFDEDLAAAGDRLAVVGHTPDHHRRTSGHCGRADRNSRIDRGQLGSTDAQQHRRERQRNQRRPQQEGKTDQRHGSGDGDHSQHGMGWDQDDRQRDGYTPARGKDERRVAGHSVR